MAALKGAFADAEDNRRQRNALQLAAILKGAGADLLQGGGKSHAFCTGAAIERQRTDAGDPITDNNAGDLIGVAAPWGGGGIAVIGDTPLARYGQGAAVQRPAGVALGALQRIGRLWQQHKAKEHCTQQRSSPAPIIVGLVTFHGVLPFPALFAGCCCAAEG